MQTVETIFGDVLAEYVPPELLQVVDPDSAIPALAKNVHDQNQTGSQSRGRQAVHKGSSSDR